MEYKSKNRKKYYLKAHLVFVTKYRKKLFLNLDMDFKIKDLFHGIAKKRDFIIEAMETDKNHIHLLVSYLPNISISSIVRSLKQNSTYWIWKEYSNYLSKIYFKEKTFFSDGYFVSSVGEIDEDTINKYIKDQGKEIR
jgi:putative transposase